MINKSWTLTILLPVLAACSNNETQEKTTIKENKPSHGQLITKQKIAIKTVGILLYDGYAVLDAMGPYHVLSEMAGVNVFFIGRHKGVITTSNGLKVHCDTSILEVPQVDILVIPGGLKETYLATRDTALLHWITAVDRNTKFTASVCTGAWILGAAGLLKDKAATTHWYGKKILAREYGAKVEDKRFVKSGKYWTSAGVTAGMDMSLELVNEIMGERYTRAAMLDLEYDPQPPFKGGTEENTDKEIVEEIRSMYDGGLEIALHPEKALRNLKFDNQRDLVCRMPVTAGVADTSIFKGKLYGFCSSGCKAEFVKEPGSYLAAE